MYILSTAIIFVTKDVIRISHMKKSRQDYSSNNGENEDRIKNWIMLTRKIYQKSDKTNVWSVILDRKLDRYQLPCQSYVL